MTDNVEFRFYAELNDFLSLRKRKNLYHSYRLKGKASVKDAIESFGIPHTEVDLILVNGTSKSFAYHLKPGDRISVYPVFESFDVRTLNRLRPTPLRTITFILDVHLGKLSKWLRIAGFDTLYRNDYEDHEIVVTAVRQTRIILTRDTGLLKNGLVTHGYFVRATDPEAQFSEVIRRFQLEKEFRPFSRCIHCNELLVSVEKKIIHNRIRPLTRQYFHEFSQCPGCGRVYWKGSHYQHMKRKLETYLPEIR